MSFQFRFKISLHERKRLFAHGNKYTYVHIWVTFLSLSIIHSWVMNEVADSTWILPASSPSVWNFCYVGMKSFLYIWPIVVYFCVFLGTRIIARHLPECLIVYETTLMKLDLFFILLLSTSCLCYCLLKMIFGVEYKQRTDTRWGRCGNRMVLWRVARLPSSELLQGGA